MLGVLAGLLEGCIRRKHIQVRGLCAVKHFSLVAERKLQYHARGPPRAPGAARCHTEEKVILGHALPAQRSVQAFIAKAIIICSFLHFRGVRLRLHLRGVRLRQYCYKFIDDLKDGGL